jgi:ABC-type spermidine/putrescine transport system permease subunit I
VRDLILGASDWGSGAALNFVMLLITLVGSLIAFRLAKLNQIDR